MKADEVAEAAQMEVIPLCARPSMKERQWHMREEAILDAATELLKTKGFNAMTLEDITESIGISRPTLYLHFKSKEDVASKVVIRNLCSVCSILSSLDPSLAPGERVRAFVRRTIEIRFDSTRIAMYDMNRIKFSQAKEDPELRKLELQFADTLAGLIREAQEEGTVWKGIRPEMFVLVLKGFLKSFEIDSMVSEGTTSPAEIQEVMEALLFCRAD